MKVLRRKTSTVKTVITIQQWGLDADCTIVRRVAEGWGTDTFSLALSIALADFTSGNGLAEILANQIVCAAECGDIDNEKDVSVGLPCPLGLIEAANKYLEATRGSSEGPH